MYEAARESKSAAGRSGPESGLFCNKFTYWEALFLKGRFFGIWHGRVWEVLEASGSFWELLSGGPDLHKIWAVS